MINQKRKLKLRELVGHRPEVNRLIDFLEQMTDEQWNSARNAEDIMNMMDVWMRAKIAEANLRVNIMFDKIEQEAEYQDWLESVNRPRERDQDLSSTEWGLFIKLEHSTLAMLI